MKKGLFVLAILLIGLAGPVNADQYYQEVTVISSTGEVVYSSALTVAGYLDKIEYVKTGAGTNTFVLATYSGMTAIDTFASKAIGGATTGVIRPRTVGMTYDGSLLTGAATTASVTTNSLGQVLTSPATSTALVAPYERFRIGGNTKIYGGGGLDGLACTNVFRIYLVPSDK